MKKRNMLIYIDGENISERKYCEIMKSTLRIGVKDGSKVYGLQNDNRTRAWTDRSHEDDNLKDIRLYGLPEKDKVDNKIKRDIRKDIRKKKNVDIIVLVTSDKGYADVIEEARTEGKSVVVIGEAKASSIIRYREENGPFSCPEDVMNISGIKNSVYEKIRDLITV